MRIGVKSKTNTAILFTPGGSGYTFTVRSITDLPTNPTGGTELTLGDDDSVSVNVGSGRTVVLYGQSYSRFYVGSNGYITFTQSDTDYSESLADHFDTPRISILRALSAYRLSLELARYRQAFASDSVTNTRKHSSLRKT